jgi:hypothetical protein
LDDEIDEGFCDAGALPTSSERGANADAFWHMINCLNYFEVGCTKLK